ncbi:MAG: hypothetical protein Q9174_003654 [Haloplaca sp. 1 TL-2023]
MSFSSNITRFFGNSRSEHSSKNPYRPANPSNDTRTLSHTLPPLPDYAKAEGLGIPEQDLPRKPANVSVVAVMGPTGSGKSTLISKLAGRPVQVGHGLKSCTQHVDEFPCIIAGRQVILVDTPGFNDTFLSDTDVLTILVDWLKESDKDKEWQFSGIIYLHSIQEPRMYGPSLENLRMFRRLCGTDNLKNVILTTTKWGITPEQDALAREEELCSNDEFWGLMIKAKSLVRRFDDTQASASSLVEEVLRTGSESFTPQIQHEIDEGKTLLQTEAGAYLNQALLKQEKKYQDEVKALKEEQERALKEHDVVMQDALIRQQTRIETALEKKQEEQRRLHQAEVGALKSQQLTYKSEVDILKKKIADLHKTMETRNGEYTNRQTFWHSSWKCLICKTKTWDGGLWTCPKCGFKQRLAEWEP